MRETLAKTVKSVWLSKPMIAGYILTTAVVVFWLVWFLKVPECKTAPCSNNWTNFWNLTPNEVGDTFAGLFGSLAFVWIVVTVFIQGQELREQKLEFSAMNSTMSKQLFESTFFEIVATYNSIVEAIDVTYTHSINWGMGTSSSKEITKTGRDSFDRFVSVLQSGYDHEKNTDGMYDVFWDKHQNDLGHYFRFLYRSFKFISEHEHSQEYHAKFLRALLSDKELVVLFYNCISYIGSDFAEYAIEFQLFDNLPGHLIFDDSHLNEIDHEAFGENETVRLNP